MLEKMFNEKVFDLKIECPWFMQQMNQRKNFEIRKMDRDWREGDVLCLREYDPIHKEYTGSVLYRRILSFCEYEQKENYAVIATEPLKLSDELNLFQKNGKNGMTLWTLRDGMIIRFDKIHGKTCFLTLF